MRVFVALVLLMLLGGCNLEAGTPGVPTATPPLGGFNTPAPLPSNTPFVAPTAPGAPTLGAGAGCVVNTSLPRYIVKAGDTLSDIATRANTTLANLVAINCLANADQIFVGQTLYTPQLIDPPSAQYYVIFGNDNGQSGIRTGCGDSAIALASGLEVTGVVHSDIQTSLTALFSASFPPAPYFTALPAGLRVNNVTVTGDFAQITLVGNLQSAGACQDARMQAQIVLTVFQYPSIARALITINGQNLRQFFDASGTVGNSDPYVANQWLP